MGAVVLGFIDRELLEAAAKTAGLVTTEMNVVDRTEYPETGRHGALWNYVGHGETSNCGTTATDTAKHAAGCEAESRPMRRPRWTVVVTQQWGELNQII